MKVLVVEDEPQVVEFLVKGLREQGYTVESAMDGTEGEKLALSSHFDIILLDVILPNVNGYELCSRIRQQQIQTPIIMLTALGATYDKISGFDAGADDYLVKPFEFIELLARIKALLKRTSIATLPQNILKVADLELNLNTKTARRGNRTIDLTAKEFLLLEFLMRNKGIVVSRAEIAEQVWEVKFDTGTNIVDVYINILRKKIDNDFSRKLIRTKIGMGYLITES
ncbi:MAG: response regulator transcription factor [Tenuifilaceae bacterium]|jgi:DNA-binding response OmpR family regulator|nr:response regulator transcription factor [Tenuifilaceae bacterium]